MTLSDGERWRLIEGDCLEVLPTIDAVDHVITDPPYSAHVHEKAAAGGNRVRCLRDGNGALSDCAYARRVELGFESLSARSRRHVARQIGRLSKRWALVFSDPESLHLWRRSLEAAAMGYGRACFWDKIGGSPQFTGDRPAAACEAITAMHRRHAGRWRWNGGGKRGLYSFPIVANRAGHRHDRVHTTQKPLELMLALVADFTDPDDLVLDPFAGSGTTGVACLRLGRRFIGIEKDPRYAALARERLEAEERGQSLQHYRAGQMPMFAVWPRR